MGKNSLVTNANAAIETASMASQLPCVTGLGGMGVALSIGFQPCSLKWKIVLIYFVVITMKIKIVEKKADVN